MDSQLSCVSIGSTGIIESHKPEEGGYAVKVQTHGISLFGGASISKGEAIHFFEYHEVAAIPDPAGAPS